jgi:hypothetical protein
MRVASRLKDLGRHENPVTFPARAGLLITWTWRTPELSEKSSFSNSTQMIDGLMLDSENKAVALVL